MLRVEVPVSKAGAFWAAGFYGSKVQGAAAELRLPETAAALIAREAWRHAEKVLTGEHGEPLVIGEDGRLVRETPIVQIIYGPLSSGNRQPIVELTWEDGRKLTERFTDDDRLYQAVAFYERQMNADTERYLKASA